MNMTRMKNGEARLLLTIQRMGLLEKMHFNTPNTYGRQRQQAENQLSRSHSIVETGPPVPGGQFFLFELTDVRKWVYVTAESKAKALAIAGDEFPHCTPEVAACTAGMVAPLKVEGGNLWQRHLKQKTAAIILVIGIDLGVQHAGGQA